MRDARFTSGALALLLLLSGCGFPGGPGDGAGVGSGTPPGHIVLAVAGEPRTLVPSVGAEGIGPADHLFEILHQSLVSYDSDGQPIARVAEAMPSIDDGTWRLLPDGTMETEFRLREGVQWHDGRPLTVDDIAFSWRVFNSSAVPVVSRRAARLIESVSSPSPRTVVFKWRSHYAFANQLSGFDLTLLPSHLLEASFDLRASQIAGHPYWQAAFVGLGPYKLSRWIAGSSLELDPIPTYFLGRPRADHMSVRFMVDDSSAMAALLSGNLDLILPRKAALGIMQSGRQWEMDGRGSVVTLPTHWAFLAPQFATPQPPDLLDPRLRQALALSIDRRAIADALVGQASLGSNLWIPPADPRYRRIADAVSAYDFNRERAAALFREAGWRQEGVDGGLMNRGNRLDLDVLVAAEWYPAATLIGDYWRQMGVGVNENVVALGNTFDRQARASYSGFELTAALPGMPLLESRLRSTNVPLAENLYVGANRGHYASAQMDQLLDRFWQAVDPSPRQELEADIARLVADDLPMIGIYFHPAMSLVVANVHGVKAPVASPVADRALLSWNAHEWEKR
jgi:peptide/nickel transport system substrate-binding protein